MKIYTLLFVATPSPYLIAVIAAILMAGVVMRRRSEPKTDSEEQQ